MSHNPTIESLDRRMQSMERMLRDLVKQKNQPLWVGPSKTKEFTGWNDDDMKRARELTWVKWRRTNGQKGYQYDINSIDQKFLKDKV